MTNQELAEKDYIAGMKYKDIADKYNVSLNTVKSWKKRKGWIRGDTHSHRKEAEKEGAHKNEERVHTKKREKPQGIVESDEEIDGPDLSAKQLEFCTYLAKCHNQTKAYMKAYGVDYFSAAASANRLLKKAKIQTYLSELREMKMQQIQLREEDILEKYIDIAYADMNDYVEIVDGQIVVKEDFDGSIVQEITPTKGGGIKIKLNDRMKAMARLEEYVAREKAKSEESEEGGVVFIPSVLEEDEDE